MILLKLPVPVVNPNYVELAGQAYHRIKALLAAASAATFRNFCKEDLVQVLTLVLLMSVLPLMNAH